jgi:hypothetical protein
MDAMKKYLRIMFVGIGLLAVAYPAWRSHTPAHRITGSNLSKIKMGMAQADVEAIFGAPPGVYSDQPVNATYWQDTDDFLAGWRREDWRTTSALCVVYFDGDAKVISFGSCEIGPAPWFDQVKRWLGL